VAGIEPLPADLANFPDKGVFIRRLFGKIAPRYDLMNRLMTASMDWRWRRAMMDEASVPLGGALLDLATGTGDVALLAVQRDSSARVVGADFSLAMMQTGKSLNGRSSIHWCGADALNLPFPDRCFDSVTSAFLIRNLPGDRLLHAFGEQARLLKPGGRVVCLDITPPPPGPLAPLVGLYMKVVIPLIGWLVTGHRGAYEYLAVSAAQFKPPDELVSIMAAAGLRDVRYRQFMLGAITLLVGIKSI